MWVKNQAIPAKKGLLDSVEKEFTRAYFSYGQIYRSVLATIGILCDSIDAYYQLKSRSPFSFYLLLYQNRLFGPVFFLSSLKKRIPLAGSLYKNSSRVFSRIQV